MKEKRRREERKGKNKDVRKKRYEEGKDDNKVQEKNIINLLNFESTHTSIISSIGVSSSR